MISIFSTNDYRVFLRAWLDSQSSIRGIMTKMAQAIECQNSHLTRVLKEEVHLSLEQAYEACLFMKFTEIETSYFIKLVDFERASKPNYKKRLKTEMVNIKAEQENLANRFKEESIGHLEKEMVYYSSWFWSAIHIITDIPRFNNPKSIAEHLGLGELFVRNCLQTLEKFGLVKRTGESWKITSEFVHLPKGSPMSPVQHGNWRTKAVLQSQMLNSDDIHYTIVQAISSSDFDKIKQIIFQSIDSYRSVANISKSEELICFTCDFFRV